MVAETERTRHESRIQIPPEKLAEEKKKKLVAQLICAAAGPLQERGFVFEFHSDKQDGGRGKGLADCQQPQNTP